ncbi:LacI family DNA-binding transcriptional regulator [Nocardioides marmoribigeumensis]|uniref:LacI family transcriptional regulator n=1 Tax=Nocardioides marmoribigeumensis TaxID=433649 RepID=A0ABU2BU90_9ACTN|nr:LacI family DNA-binding transcriptional regulator [Nocardioides marmoribigeumensis]MDR7361841.1 LacI family transcriptional regulator [Nocardioides marmoribigeumensis]
MAERRAHRVSDIVTQSGLSRATVDRVLHGRAGVRPSTVAQVQRAIEELDRQRDQVHLSARPLILDLVMQAPQRFSAASRQALEDELQALRPAVVRVRSHLDERSDPTAAARLVDGLAARGCDGLVLKAPDHPAVREAVDRLARAGVPTVTFVTDVTGCARAAYVGVDNRAAGATAAYLVHHWTGSTGDVLVTESSAAFHGEEERIAGFAETLADLSPGRAVRTVTGTDGLDLTMHDAVAAVLAERPGLDAVYSVGGGNRATLAAFAAAGRRPAAFVAHDLDRDNRGLLRRHELTAVLHHDLRADMRRAVRMLLQARGILPGRPVTLPSQVQVVTPFNEPSGLASDDAPPGR